MTESQARVATEDVLTEIYRERAVQRARWGNEHDDHHGAAHWAMILGTYFGRVLTVVFHYTQPLPTAEAELRHVDYDLPALRSALVKVAATAVAWVEAIDRKKGS